MRERERERERKRDRERENERERELSDQKLSKPGVGGILSPSTLNKVKGLFS